MRDAETLTMSAKEVDRLEIIGRVVERRLTQRAPTSRRTIVPRLSPARRGGAGVAQAWTTEQPEARGGRARARRGSGASALRRFWPDARVREAH